MQKRDNYLVPDQKLQVFNQTTYFHHLNQGGDVEFIKVSKKWVKWIFKISDAKLNGIKLSTDSDEIRYLKHAYSRSLGINSTRLQGRVL